MIYRNNLKNREFGKEAPQNSRLERATIAYRQGASEGENFEGKPTLPKTDSSGCFGIYKRILLCVGALHALFALWILTPHSPLHPKKVHKPLIVKTFSPPSKTQIAYAERRLPSAPRTSSAPSKKESAQAPTPKKIPPVKKESAIQDKVLSPHKSPPKKPPAPRATVSEDLQRALEESIAKIEGKQDKFYPKKSAKAAHNPAPPLQIDAHIEGEEQQDYAALIVSYLHQSLALPEFGEVKISLTLRGDGSVAKLVVIQAESQKNKKYLEANLSALKFPPLGAYFANKRECTFTITFCNEI